jgi:3'-5' exoribonuclease
MIDLKTLAAGTRVQDPFLVQEVDERTTKDGKAFATLTLGNASGSIKTAPFWEEQLHQVAGIAKGAVVQVIGEAGAYQGTPQLRITSIRVLPAGSVEYDQLVPSIPAAEREKCWESIDKWIAELKGKRLKATIGLFYDDADFRARYEQCPAATVGHHAYLGGLLRHTVEVLSIGRHVARIAGADVDLVTAGILLHDIGKLQAYRWDGALQPTEKNVLYGHVVLGALELERRVRAATPMPCTEQELDILQHLILSHHGLLEYGAAVRPATLEAEIVHFADNASAKTASFNDALGDATNFGKDELVSAKPLWELDRRRAYRGKSDWGR